MQQAGNLHPVQNSLSAVTPAQRAPHGRAHHPANRAAQGRAGEELRDAPYLLPEAEIARRAAEAWERGATEVCIQGGIHPEFTGAPPGRRLAWDRTRARLACVPGQRCAARAGLPMRAGAARSRAGGRGRQRAARALMHLRHPGALCAKGETRGAAAQARRTCARWRRPRRARRARMCTRSPRWRSGTARRRCAGRRPASWRRWRPRAWAACRAPRPRCCATLCAPSSAPTS